MRIASLVLRLFVLLLFAAADLRAERLPIRAYTTTDGLADNSVNRIVADSRGFLWFWSPCGRIRGVLQLHTNRR